jgi:hypothetical protein
MLLLLRRGPGAPQNARRPSPPAQSRLRGQVMGGDKPAQREFRYTDACCRLAFETGQL